MGGSILKMNKLSFTILTIALISFLLGCGLNKSSSRIQSDEQRLNSIQGSWKKINCLHVNEETGYSKYYEYEDLLRYNIVDVSGDTLRMINYPYDLREEFQIKIEGDTIFFKEYHRLAFFYEFREDTLVLKRYVGELLEENYFVKDDISSADYTSIKNYGVNWEALKSENIWSDVDFFDHPAQIALFCFGSKNDSVPANLNLTQMNSSNYRTNADSLYYLNHGETYIYLFRNFNQDENRLYLNLICSEGKEEEIKLWYSRNE